MRTEACSGRGSIRCSIIWQLTIRLAAGCPERAMKRAPSLEGVPFLWNRDTLYNSYVADVLGGEPVPTPDQSPGQAFAGTCASANRRFCSARRNLRPGDRYERGRAEAVADGTAAP